MLFWIFFVRSSSRSTVIFLIVSKEIQKYDQRKFYFFSEKKHFQIWYSSLKKKLQKKFTICFPYIILKNKKIRNNQNFEKKNFAKYIISQTSDTKEIRDNIVKKIFAEIFVWKKNFRQKKFDKKNFHQKKICRKNFRKKNFSEKNIRKKFFK